MRAAMIALLALVAFSPVARAAPHFGFTAPLGTYNKATLRAGFAVYQADCAACHGISAVRARDLAGLGVSPAAMARWRALRPTQQPAAPDLSLIATALPHGAASIVSLLRVHHPPKSAAMAHDVAEFLAWSADPTLDQRKSIMLRAMIYLAIFGLIGFFALRQDRTP
ncbi:ubiquinol-cytochrome c reductase cytochrome c1 subunit [Acidiphilium sp. MT5]